MKNEKLNKLSSMLSQHIDKTKANHVCRRMLNTISPIIMKTKELNILNSVLNSQADTEYVNAACRSILCERLRDEELLENSLRILLEKIVNDMEFPLHHETIEESREETMPNRLLNKTALICLLVAVIGLYMTYSNGTLGIVGGLITFCSGAFFGMAKKRTTKVTKEVKQVVATSAEELMAQIDKTYRDISCLFDYRQLEHKNKDILWWFQNQYSYSEDEEYRQSIERLLRRTGYSLCEYSDERFSDFDSTTAKVDTPVTSVYAIVNKNGEVVCRGHVIFPM